MGEAPSPTGVAPAGAGNEPRNEPTWAVSPAANKRGVSARREVWSICGSVWDWDLSFGAWRGDRRSDTVVPPGADPAVDQIDERPSLVQDWTDVQVRNPTRSEGVPR